MTVLRPYQIKAVDEIEQAMIGLGRHVLFQLATGGGKTEIAKKVGENAAARGERALILTHRREILNQTSRKLSFGNLDHGLIQAGLNVDLEYPIQIASVQTFWARCMRTNKIPLPRADLIIVDECFPAGTLIDGTPIEKLRVGDFVRSFNHSTNSVERRRVTRTFCQRPTALVTVHLCDGRAITCTANHPFYTPHGYVAAQSLLPNSEVLSIDGTKTENSRNALHHLWHDGDVPREENVGAGQTRTRLLLERTSRPVGQTERREDAGADQQEICFGAHDRQQSNAQIGDPTKGVAGVAAYGSPTAISWWQRHGTDKDRSDAIRSNGLETLDRNNWERVSTVSLQNRLGRSEFTAGGRDRRREPLHFSAPRTGRAEGGVSDWARVDFVEVHQPTSAGEYARLCCDGLVYNFEVEDNHNYFVDGILVHNCQHVRASTWSRILDRYPNARRLGLTATPCRSDGKGLGNYFDTLIEGPSVAELISDKWLVPTIYYAPTEPDLKGVKVQVGDYQINALSKRMNRDDLIGDIVSTWFKFGEGRKTICFAIDVPHSRHIEQEFVKAGVKCEHLDAHTPKADRDDILERLSSGDTQIVVNVGIISEGYDCPVASCIILARPTKQLGLYRQMAGRGLRPAPDKTNLVLIDHAGAVFKHGLLEDPIKWTLATDKRAENPTHAKRDIGAIGRLIKCSQCSAMRTAGEKCPHCGFLPQRRPDPILFRDGELARVNQQTHQAIKVFDPNERTQWHAMLAFIAADHGYKPGWIAYKYKEKFGEWPRRGSQPVPIRPAPEVLAWVRSRNIAYAKAKEKERAA